MEIIDNINHLLGENLKRTIKSNSKLKIAATCFSIYAFAALKRELERIESLEFIFTSPTFVPQEVTDKIKKEQREFHIPKAGRERNFFGSEFEIQLKNKLTQRAIAKECADWMRRKATFRSNHSKAPMQQFACVENKADSAIYMPLHGFTAVDLGYQQGDAVSNIVNKLNEPTHTGIYLNLFDQIWNDPEKLDDVTERLCEHIASVYQENSPERIYFLMLYNIFNEFLEDLNEDVLPNDRTGYRDSLIWQKLFNFQKDAATGIINKLETYNGCILADSVGLGKTFNIKDDRTAEDLLFQVLLDWGVDLTLPITQETIAGKTVLFVDGNALAACFDADINEGFVKELATHHPLRVVFRDSGFISDSVKINVEQVFKLISPTTEIKVI